METTIGKTHMRMCVFPTIFTKQAGVQSGFIKSCKWTSRKNDMNQGAISAYYGSKTVTMYSFAQAIWFP
jgi:hypothetical protein